jgi:rubrerythrin
MTNDAKLSVTENWVLDTCSMLEETCAALYRYFAELFADDPDACALWSKTALEEDSHAEQFRMAYRLRGNGIESLKIDMNRAKDLLAKMQSIFKHVQEDPPTLKEAFHFAIRMEYSLAEYHMDSIAKYTDKGLEKLFVSMRQCDQEHIQMLEQAYNKLQD